MTLFTSVISVLCLSLAFSFTQAGLLRSRANSPPPTRPFTVSTYEEDDPVGTGATGYNMTARGGYFYLSGKANIKKAVLFVSGDGRAYLDSKTPQPVYVDTSDGHLGYANPAPAGACFVDFLHLGYGNQILHQSSDGGIGTAPGSFAWIGQQQDGAWFGCDQAKNNGDLKVFKNVADFGPPALDLVYSCIGLSLSALDYSGPNPAVGHYP